MKLSLPFYQLSFLGAATAASLQDCGSTAKDLQTRIVGCSDADQACIFEIGQKATIEATFTTVSPFNSAVIKLSASIGPATLPFPLTPAEACGNWGLKCPSTTGTRQTLRVEIPIESSYPKMKVGVELLLVTDKAEKLICKSFPAEIR